MGAVRMDASFGSPSTDNADPSACKARGGKTLTWHGLPAVSCQPFEGRRSAKTVRTVESSSGDCFAFLFCNTEVCSRGAILMRFMTKLDGVHLPIAAAALSCAMVVSPIAHGHATPEIANCSELKDEATVPLTDLCLGHTGCRFMLNAQKTCAQAKGYLERLQAAIGEGTKTLFGHRKEVTPDAVFTAALGADEMQKQRSLGERSDVQKEAQAIASRVRGVGNGDTLTGTHGYGIALRQWVYYGQTSGGQANGIGTRIYSDGEIQRGQTMNDTLAGAGEVLAKSGSRFVGSYSELGSGQRTGIEFGQDGSWFKGTRTGGYTDGTFARADGTYFVGLRDPNGARIQGREIRADNSLVEEGRFEGKVLSVGTQYDATGVATTVNRPAEREATARAASETVRLAADAEQQRKREQAAQAEQQFRASLQTMNPGQLFAKAGELQTQGDQARSREVQRVLVSRFPDHPLAASAARQMTGESAGGLAPRVGGSTPADSDNATNRPEAMRISAQACDAMKRSVITTRIPSNASITASQETVMFMTKTVLDMIVGGCPTDGATPAQIRAERQERQQQYTAAENGCNAVQSGGRRCVAHNHFGLGGAPPSSTSAASARSTATTSPAQHICDESEKADRTVSKSYDPVSGQMICGARLGQSGGTAGPSSGGGGARRPQEDNRTCKNCTAN